MKGIPSSLATLLVCLCATVAGAQTWNHDPNAQIGPLNWGHVTHDFGTCGEKITGSFSEVGKRQTPVAIDATQTIPLPRLIFNYKATDLEVENTGHVVEVPYHEGSTLRVDGFFTGRPVSGFTVPLPRAGGAHGGWQAVPDGTAHRASQCLGRPGGCGCFPEERWQSESLRGRDHGGGTPQSSQAGGRPRTDQCA